MLRFLPLLLFLIACQPDVPQLERTWVRQYTEYSDYPSSLTADRTHLVRFTKDSMLGNFLPMDFYEGEKFLWYDSYTVVGDSLFTVGESYAHTYGINLQRDSLTLTIENQKAVYRPLPRYRQATHYGELYELFSGAEYFLRDSIRFELTENHLLFVDCAAYEHWDRRIWSLYNYDGELFFIIGDALGVNWHIKSFNQDSVTAVIYGEENEEVILIRRPNEINIDGDLLKGRWRRIDSIPLMPRDLIAEEGRYVEPEELYITDSTLNQQYLRLDKKYSKFTNPAGDVLHLDWKHPSREHYDQLRWEIEVVGADTLVIKRNDQRTHMGTFEAATFVRVSKK